jgi:hypothetical protein
LALPQANINEILVIGACMLPQQQRDYESRHRSHHSKRRIFDMLVTKKMLLALTLVGALVGAGIGSLMTHSAASNTAANTTSEADQSANPDLRYTDAAYRTDKTPDQIAAERSSQFSSTAEQTAFRQGYDEGYAACSNTPVNTQRNISPASYRSTSGTPVRRYSNSRRSYYDYGTAPRGRTFWQKHRDKLSLAIGTGGGALVGGLIGGKKGAGIGSLVGLGSSALYTYKLRKRTRRY